MRLLYRFLSCRTYGVSVSFVQAFTIPNGSEVFSLWNASERWCC